MSGTPVEVGAVGTGWSARSVWGPAVVAVLLAGVAGTAVGIGLGRHDRILQLCGAALFALVAVVGAHTLRPRSGTVVAAVMVAAVTVVGGVSATVAAMATPTDRGAGANLLYTPAGERVVVYLHGEAGGPEATGAGAPAPLRSGQGYAFACTVVVDRAGIPETWARAADGSGWVPVTAVRDASGRVPRGLPPCRG